MAVQQIAHPSIDERRAAGKQAPKRTHPSRFTRDAAKLQPRNGETPCKDLFDCRVRLMPSSCGAVAASSGHCADLNKSSKNSSRPYGGVLESGSSARSTPAPARPPRRRPLPGADQAPLRSWRSHQRIRACCVEAQVKSGGRVLEPHKALNTRSRKASPPSTDDNASSPTSMSRPKNDRPNAGVVIAMTASMAGSISEKSGSVPAAAFFSNSEKWHEVRRQPVFQQAIVDDTGERQAHRLHP